MLSKWFKKPGKIFRRSSSMLSSSEGYAAAITAARGGTHLFLF
jgi:hypothetical protein